jgi:zinc transport system substrate-binding protein
MSLRASALLPLVALVVAGCGASGAASGGGPRVVASPYPLAFVAGRVAGGRAEVVSLTTGQADPHDADLSPRQVAAVTDADLLLYVGEGFQPALDELAAGLGERALDVRSVSRGPTSGDPHVWLDPVAMAAIARATGERMGAIVPGQARASARRAAALAHELRGLHREFLGGLARCRDRVIVTSHEAFGHLARRYELVQIGIAGLDPESEPAPGRVAEITTFARDHDVSTVFVEGSGSPRLAGTIAAELGIETAVLDPLEAPPAGTDYLGAMRDNLAALREALGCQ